MAQPSAIRCRNCIRPKPMSEEQLTQVLRQVLAQHAWSEASNEMAANRMAICTRCARYDQQGTCRVCGCLLRIRTRITEQHCPDPNGTQW